MSRVENLKIALGLFMEAEDVISGLYLQGSQKWSDHEDLFRSISRDKKQHREFLEKILSLFSQETEEFKLPRDIDPDSYRTIVNVLKTNYLKMKKNKISIKEFLQMMLFVETTIINIHESLIVTGDDPYYKKIVSTMKEEAERHRIIIDSTINNLH